MNKILIFCIGLFFLNPILAQEKMYLESPDVFEALEKQMIGPEITGYIEGYNPKLKQEYLVSFISPQFSNFKSKTYRPKIDDEGRFSFRLTQPIPFQQLWFGIGFGDKNLFYTCLYVNKGLKLKISLDPQRDLNLRWKSEYVSFDGPDADLNAYYSLYMRETTEEKNEIDNERDQIRRDREKSLADKIEIIRNSYNDIKELNDAFIKEHPSPHAWLLENNRKSEMYGDIFVLHWMKEMDENLFQEALAHKPVGLSNETSSYYSYLGTFLKITPKAKSDQIEENLVLSRSYPREVKDSLDVFWPEYQKKKDGQDYDKEIYRWGKLRFWPAVKEELEEKLLSLQIERIHKLSHHKRSVVAYVSQPDDLWGREKYLTKATPVLEESWFNTQLQENLERDQKRVAKLAFALDEEAELDIPHKLGRKVLELENDVEFFMANHQSVEALMTSIQEAHKDTAIIFDIWATWCGPCLLDMRGSKDMKKQLADLPVKVVYLCLSSHGSNPKDWKRLIADMEISGEHIFLEEDLYKAFAKKYEISYYPTYLFMDKAGNIDRNLVQRIEFINLEALRKRL